MKKDNESEKLNVNKSIQSVLDKTREILTTNDEDANIIGGSNNWDGNIYHYRFGD
jgi:hypothetical protein